MQRRSRIHGGSRTTSGGSRSSRRPNAEMRVARQYNGPTCGVLQRMSPWGMVEVLTVDQPEGKSLSWEELQSLKNDFLGPEVRAVEIFPEAGEVVNSINRRWLWAVPAHVELPTIQGGGS